MASPEFALKRTIVTRLTKRAYRRVKPLIPSRTLRKALFWEVTPRPRGFLEVPHYWAVYYHRGTGIIAPVRAKYLVWYQRAIDDPRLNKGKGPERARFIKRLTKDQWEEGLRRNYLRRKKGLRPFMLVSKARKGLPGVPFYDAALGSFGGSGGLLGEARKIGLQEFNKYIKKVFRDLKISSTRVREVRFPKIRL